MSRKTLKPTPKPTKKPTKKMAQKSAMERRSEKLPVEAAPALPSAPAPDEAQCLGFITSSVLLCDQRLMSADGKVTVPPPVHTGGVESAMHKGSFRKPPLYPWAVGLSGEDAEKAIQERNPAAWERLEDGTYRMYCDSQMFAETAKSQIASNAHTHEWKVSVEVHYADLLGHRCTDMTRGNDVGVVAAGLVALPNARWTVTVWRSAEGQVTQVTLKPETGVPWAPPL